MLRWSHGEQQHLKTSILSRVLYLQNYLSVHSQQFFNTVCPRRSDPFYLVAYNIKWVTTSWTHSMYKTIFSALNSYRILYNGQKYCPSSYCDFYTICPRSSDPFYIVSYYTKLVTTSWTHSMKSDKTCWAKYLKDYLLSKKACVSSRALGRPWSEYQ